MTVAHLWKELLKGYKQKNTFPISHINGKRIAVDFSAILHKIMAPKESKSSASVCLQHEPKYPPEEVVAKFEFYHNHFVQNKAVPLYVFGGRQNPMKKETLQNRYAEKARAESVLQSLLTKAREGSAVMEADRKSFQQSMIEAGFRLNCHY